MNDDHKEFIVAAAIVGLIVLGIVGLAQGWFFETEEVFTVAIGNDPVIGSRDAPITIVEFSDFSCAYCAAFAKDTKPTLMEYVESGRVRFAFKDYPLVQIHPRAVQVAKAAGCADEQEMFWDYHDLLYENIDDQEIGDLRRYADQVGLNLTQYDECFANERRYAEIQTDVQEGRVLGVTGTPTFFINGKRHVGYLTPEQLRELLDDA